MRGRIYYEGRTCPHIYLCYYFPVETGPDFLSQSLIRFKYGLYPDTEGWIARALEALKRLPPGTVIVRALHHDECSLDGAGYASLDDLGREIAARCNGHYHPWLLGKRRPTTRLRDLHTKERRILELEGVYFIREPVAADRVLVIDDILTTGTTVKAILKVLSEAWPAAKFAVFSLAKTNFH